MALFVFFVFFVFFVTLCEFREVLIFIAHCAPQGTIRFSSVYSA